MKHNYLVSVFVGGKNVNSYYSVKLDDLVTIKALHKGCEISIFDMQNFVYLSKEEVECEIQRSGFRWKQSLDKSAQSEMDGSQPLVVKKRRLRKVKPKKYWERAVMCIETGQVFNSIRKCCEHFGLSHKSVWNAINSGKTRKGFHFINAPKLQS